MADHTEISDSPESASMARWFGPVLAHGSQACAANLDTRMAFLRHGGVEIPLTHNEAEWDNCWICSPFTHFITYAIEEIRRATGPATGNLMASLLGLWGNRLKDREFNRVVMVNNALFSTCPWPTLPRQSAAPVIHALRERFPGHARVFRSLNYRECPEFIDGLAEQGLLLLPSRQVWWFEPKDPVVARSRDFLADARLLQRGDLELVQGRIFTPTDYQQSVALYRQLYLQKYSHHNPQYSEGWLRHLQEAGIMELTGLRAPDGRLVGVEGRVESHGVLTSPVVGYDTTLPVKLGLYRRLAVIPILEARQRGIPLNLSAGVGRFKASRGGEPVMEYLAVDLHGLPSFRRRPWKILAAFARHVLAPYARSHGL